MFNIDEEALTEAQREEVKDFLKHNMVLQSCLFQDQILTKLRDFPLQKEI